MGTEKEHGCLKLRSPRKPGGVARGPWVLMPTFPPLDETSISRDITSERWSHLVACFDRSVHQTLLANHQSLKADGMGMGPRRRIGDRGQGTRGESRLKTRRVSVQSMEYQGSRHGNEVGSEGSSDRPLEK